MSRSNVYGRWIILFPDAASHWHLFTTAPPTMRKAHLSQHTASTIRAPDFGTCRSLSARSTSVTKQQAERSEKLKKLRSEIKTEQRSRMVKAQDKRRKEIFLPKKLGSG